MIATVSDWDMIVTVLVVRQLRRERRFWWRDKDELVEFWTYNWDIYERFSAVSWQFEFWLQERKWGWTLVRDCATSRVWIFNAFCIPLESNYRGLEGWISGRALAYHVWGPGFHLPRRKQKAKVFYYVYYERWLIFCWVVEIQSGN